MVLSPGAARRVVSEGAALGARAVVDIADVAGSGVADLRAADVR
jgi:hypothetical protein